MCWTVCSYVPVHTRNRWRGTSYQVRNDLWRGKFDVSNDIMHGGWGGGGGGGGAACLTEQLVTLGSYQPSLSLFLFGPENHYF